MRLTKPPPSQAAVLSDQLRRTTSAVIAQQNVPRVVWGTLSAVDNAAGYCTFTQSGTSTAQSNVPLMYPYSAVAQNGDLAAAMYVGTDLWVFGTLAAHGLSTIVFGTLSAVGGGTCTFAQTGGPTTTGVPIVAPYSRIAQDGDTAMALYVDPTHLWVIGTLAFEGLAADAAEDDALVTTTSTTLADLGGPGLSFVVGMTGRVVVDVAATMGCALSPPPPALAIVRASLDGAPTGPGLFAPIGGTSMTVSRRMILSATPGAHTFGMLYACLDSGNGAQFADRVITVEPL